MPEDKLKRKVQFYRLRALNPDEALPAQRWGNRLDAVAEHAEKGTAHHHSPDGMVLLGRVVDNAATKSMALYVVRYDDLPARERDGRSS